MRKLLFVVFALLYVTPSVADCAFGLVKKSPSNPSTKYVLPTNAKTGPGTQYIEDEYTILHPTDPTKVRYVQCGPSNETPGATDDRFVYCSIGSKVLAGDGHIYQCKNNKTWVQLNDTSFPDCKWDKITSRDDSTGSYLIAAEKNLTYVFFPNHIQWHQIKDVCKVKLQDYYQKEDECTLNGGQFLFTAEDVACDTGQDVQPATLTVSVVNDQGTVLSDVSFTYPNMNLEQNKNKNAAKQQQNGTYTMPVDHYMNLATIKISREGYASQTMTAKEIQEKGTITLVPGNDQTPTGSEISQNLSRATSVKNEQNAQYAGMLASHTPDDGNSSENQANNAELVTECETSGGERDDTDKCICSTERGLKPDNEENPQKCECTEDGFQYNKDAQKCVAPTQTKDLSIDTTCVDSGGTPAEDGTCTCDKTKNLKPSEDNKQCVQNSPQVSEEEFRQHLSAAQDKFNQAKENEQSDANRALTSLSTAATGLGTMAAASALAERKADEKAEADMRQYLTTFECEYGKGNIVKTGNEEITIPGGNELSKYYAEYKSLADNLKTTKTALGLRAGIESETLYNQAQTGLYQYSTAERQTGAYASLSRALTDPESEDAAMWAKQQKDTKTKLIAGTAVAGAGVVGGIIGNQIINGGKKTELQRTLDTAVEEIEERLPAFVFTPTERTPIDISLPTPTIDTSNLRARMPTLTQLNERNISLDLKGDATFDTGKSTVKDPTVLNALVTRLQNIMTSLSDNQKVCIDITGHTDRTQYPRGSNMNNTILSTQRAESVKTYLETQLSNYLDKIIFNPVQGVGEQECSKEKYPKSNDPECRRVNVLLKDCTPESVQ